jgi:phosphatidylserine decarboxylase
VECALTKDGYGIVFGSLILTVLCYVSFTVYDQTWAELPTYILIIFTLFCVNFFRDPDAKDASTENDIISPAQGTVVQIREIEHDDYIGGPATQVSIFLSVFNIHVNSHPISGKVGFFKYQKGKMLAAFNHDASEQNEQTIIGLENDKFKIVHKQITGLIARRIICRVSEGQNVTKGERFGMIRFGSRCDVIVPKSVEIKVKLKDKVERGETVIGAYIG